MRRAALRGLLLGLAWGLATGCPRTVPEAAPEVVPPPPKGPPPAGRLDGGRYVDAQHGFSLARPASWILQIGRDADALRMRMVHDETGVMLELWAFEGASLAPRPRPDCLWSFTDVGPYQGLPGNRETGIGSCVPDDPATPLVMAWMHPLPTGVLQLEVHYPEGTLVGAEPMVRALLATFRAAGAGGR